MTDDDNYRRHAQSTDPPSVLALTSSPQLPAGAPGRLRWLTLTLGFKVVREPCNSFGPENLNRALLSPSVMEAIASKLPSFLRAVAL